MHNSANNKSKRLEEGQRNALEQGGEDGRIIKSAYGSEGFKVNESAT